jgi:hypothetical protein
MKAVDKAYHVFNRLFALNTKIGVWGKEEINNLEIEFHNRGGKLYIGYAKDFQRVATGVEHCGQYEYTHEPVMEFDYLCGTSADMRTLYNEIETYINNLI